MALFTAIGSLLGYGVGAAAAGGVTAFGAGVAATAVGAGVAATTIYSSSAASTASKKKGTPELPKGSSSAEQISAAKDRAQENIAERRRAMARSQTVYTSPLGLGEEAAMGRKTLLGQ